VLGRDAELSVAREHVDAARAGSASTLLVSGEAGIGKTTVMDQALREAAAAGVVMLRGAGMPLESLSSPFMVVRSALRALPEGVPRPPDVGGGSRSAAVDPVEFDAWLGQVCAERPVVLAVDDLHWVDRESLDVLRYVVAGGRDRSLCVLLTLRTEDVGEGHRLHRWLADVQRLPGFAELRLGPLDRFETGRHMAQVMGGVPHESLVEEVFRRSAGNPYLSRLLVMGVEPTATTLPEGAASGIEDAVLAAWHGMSPEARELTTVLAIAGRGLTRAELAELVAGRMKSARVPSWLAEAVERGVLDVDSTGRYWFHHPLQAELLERRAHPDDRRDWHETCAKTLVARLDGDAESDAARVVAISDHFYAAGMAEDAYRWSLQVAAGLDGAVSLEDVARALTRSLELHGRVREVDESQVDLLWRLRRVADDTGDLEQELETVESLIAAEDQAVRPEVVAELMVRRIQLTLLIRPHPPDAGDAEIAVSVASRCPGTWQHALALAQLSDDLLWSPGGRENLARARAIADQALSIAERTGHHRALAHAFAAAAFASLNEGELTRSRDLARRAHEEARASGDVWALVSSVAMVGNVIGWPRAIEILELWDQALRDLAEMGAPHTWMAAVAHDSSRSAIDRGQVATARMRIRFALGANPGPLAELGTRVDACRLATLTGSLEEAKQHQARADELAGGPIDIGSWASTWGAEVVRAQLLLATGHPWAAFEQCRSGLGQVTWAFTMGEWLLPLAAAALADMKETSPQSNSSGPNVEDLVSQLERDFPLPPVGSARSSPIPLDGSLSNPGYAREIRGFDAWYAAELARAKRSPDAADVWERAAVRLDEAGLPWEAAYAWMRLGEARLLGERPDRKAAAAALRGAVERAAPLEARPVLEKVEALARSARIDVSVVPEPKDDGGPPGLTRREREILEHVVAGRTYAEIAKALVVSEKTVSSHISNMLRKTGTSNRHELAAQALASRR
jgi:DNA-binding CsgD family transcriptional regulator